MLLSNQYSKCKGGKDYICFARGSRDTHGSWWGKYFTRNNKDSRKKIKNKFPLARICPAE
jgi:hypothetical protein